MKNKEFINRLEESGKLSGAEWYGLLSDFTEEDRLYAAELAAKIAKAHFGNRVYFRGIIEFSNICKNDCLYCGIRKSNKNAVRYRLSEEDILLCCSEGYRLGYRTFVLQSGEDGYLTDERMIQLIKRIKVGYPDCAITLSIGERSRESYEKMYLAGADRYLLRHETADKEHYMSMHPPEMSFENRIRCLFDLREIGYQVGCGMMVGSPFQTAGALARDMQFMCAFQPEMVGIGPFIPHKDTPFAAYPAGKQKLTLFLLSLTRIMLPDVLLPATTALGSVSEDGRIQGILSGCNVVMPNLSPQNVRKNYMLYDNKAGINLSAEESLALLKKQVESAGYEIIVGRGDHKNYAKENMRK